MGGTSADICLIKDGRPAVTHEGEIGPFPLHIPMTDIHTIGAGGGSIAAVTSLGSLTAGPLAQLLGTPTILIPPYPGLLSALGLLATDIQHDVMRTFVQRGPHYDLADMEAVYRALHAEATAHLAAEGLPSERQSFQRLADLRYARQGFEVTIDFPGEEIS